MRIWISTFSLLAFVAATLAASQTKPASDTARQAEKRFLKAVQEARDNYITDLELAAREALTTDKLSEAIRIKETIAELKARQTLDSGDPVVQLRRKLTNTSWKLVRDNDPNNFEMLRFSPRNRVAKVYGKKTATGIWESIEPRVAILKFNEKLLLMQFDEAIGSFKIAAFGPAQTAYTSGSKVRQSK